MTARDNICNLVREYDGCSLHERRDELAHLVARGVDDPEQAVQWTTNCGTFSLGILHALGLEHELVSRPYRIGMAISWLVWIAKNLGVYSMPPDHVQSLQPGCLLLYTRYVGGQSNEHVEWLLSTPDTLGVAEHGGGGRPQNAITAGVGTILSSSGRPLSAVLDFAAALEAQEVYP